MKQEYIIGDVVMYDNKIMVIKEPRDGIHFDLSCPEEKLVYCYVGVEDINPMPLTYEMLEKNGWKKEMYSSCKGQYTMLAKDFDDNVSRIAVVFFKQVIKAEVWHRGYHLGIYLSYVHQLQHLFFGLGIDFDFNLGNSKKGGD